MLAHQLSFEALIRQRARNQGSAPFCRFKGRTTTFRELETSVDAMAAALAQRGVGRGDRVALMLPNCMEHVVIFFALSWIGAVAVPISIHLRQSGLTLQLQSSLPRHVVADAAYQELCAALPAAASVQTVIWHGQALPYGVYGSKGSSAKPETADARDAVGSAELPKHVLLSSLCAAASSASALRASESAACANDDGLDQLCAICYTSGTTGAPKGVMLNQRWFQIGAKNAGLLADARASDVLFLWEPFYHVAGWITVLMALQHGIPVAMVEKFSASQCWRQIQDCGATLFHYLGGALNLLLKQPPSAHDGDNPVRIAWGAAAPAHSWRAFETRFRLRIREGYGISEAGNFTLLNLDGPAGSIGKPVKEFDAWIEDAQGGRAQPGEIGEIVLRPKRSGFVMQGYFNDPVRSREVLRHGCVYTGDLGYQDAQGWFYFSGRRKDALRRRGENVSAWEVERIVNAHEAVEESAVIGVDSDLGEQDILAFVKPAAGRALEPLAIIRWCEQHLAYYQIPRYIRIVADFPRGPTQRIRKTELSADTSQAWDFEASGQAPRARRASRAVPRRRSS